MKTNNWTNNAVVLLLGLFLTGCADLSLPQSNRIYEEHTTTPATQGRLLVVSEAMDWSASEKGNRYNFYLPPGTYNVIARDENYWYYKAPEQISLGDTKLFSNQDRRSYDGGIFISRNPGSPHSSGAYIDYQGAKKVLLFYFDSRFTKQEGTRWHYVE